MTLVFDTTALSRFLDEDDSILCAVAREEYQRYAVPLAADAELRFGFMNGSRYGDNIAKYRRISKRLAFEIVPPDQDTAVLYAELAAWAKRHGVALSNNDIWIGAACMQLGGKLLTLDNDFGYLPQISRAAIEPA